MAVIGIDATPVSATGKGLPRFLYQLIIELAKIPSHHQYIVFLNQHNQLPELPEVEHIEYCPIAIINSLIWSTIQQPIVLRNQQVDILFTCADRVPLLFKGKIIFYLFELPKPRHELAAGIRTRYERFSATITEMWFPYSLKATDLLIVSSQATQKAVNENFSVSASIKVIYPGRTESFTPAPENYDKSIMRQRLGADEGYIFHISSVNDKRDNTPMALRAFSHALPNIPAGIKMVIGGRTDPQAQGLMPLIQELNLEDKLIWTGFIADEDLADVYRSAELYLDTSLYEGFGYQVLESMSCGTPVVCSNAASLPEVVGDAAVTANPSDISTLAEGIINLLTSESYHAEMRERGFVQAGKFHWTDSMQQIVETINSVVETI